MPGKTIGPYQVLDEIGRGGMAVVYRARDPNLERELAVKVLHAHLADSEEARRRFRREARAVAALDRHPNIIDVYACSPDDERELYIATEYIRGVNLKEFVERHPIRIPELAVLLVLPVAGGLAYAHAQGIIHRDIKPENVMVRDDGVLKIMDFGIAHIRDAQRHLTQTGAILGSPAFMSPEHIDGKALDPRADVFSLGTLLYFLATGSLPFQGDNTHALLRNILESRYAPPRERNPLIGVRLGHIIARALQRDIEARYPTMEALRRDLAAYVAEEGFADPEGALQVYLADPDVYQDNLASRLAERLLARAREAAARRQLSRAMDLYNRVLALDEDNAAVLAEVARVSGRQRRGRIARLLALAALVLGVAAAAFVGARGIWNERDLSESAAAAHLRQVAAVARLLGDRQGVLAGHRAIAPTEDPTPAVPIWDGRRRWAYGARVPELLRRGERLFAPRRDDPGLEHWYGDKRQGPREGSRQLRLLEPEAEPTLPANPPGGRRPPGLAPRLVDVRLDVDIPAVAIYLGARRVAPRQVLRIPAGRHQVRLVHTNNARLQPDVQELVIDADRPPADLVRYRFRVHYRPALLVVKAAQDGSVVVRGQRETGRTNRALTVEMGDQPTRRVRVKVGAAGGLTWTGEVDVEAGEQRVVPVELAPQGKTPENR